MARLVFKYGGRPTSASRRRVAKPPTVSLPPAPDSQGGLLPLGGGSTDRLRRPVPYSRRPATPIQGGSATSPTVGVPAAPSGTSAPLSKDPGVREIQLTERRHTEQAQKSAQWLAAVLTALQNGSNQASAVLQSRLGTSALAFEQAGQVQGPQIGSLNQGGAIGGLAPTPDSASGMAQAAMTGALRGDLQRAGISDTTSSLISGASKYASSLPSVYADKIAAYRQDVDEFREKMRQFGIEQETARLGISQRAETAAAGQQNQRDIAAASQQTQRDITAANIASREQIAVLKAAGINAEKVGSYKGLSAKEYTKLLGTWSTKMDKLSRETDTVPGVGLQPATKKPRYTAREVFDLSVRGNVRPRDALRLLIATRYDTVDGADARNFYEWVKHHIPEANARSVVKSVTGIDPLPTTSTTKPSRTRAGLGD